MAKTALSLYLLKPGASPVLVVPSIAEEMLNATQSVAGDVVQAWLVDTGYQKLAALPRAMPACPLLILRQIPSSDSWLNKLQEIIPVFDLKKMDPSFGALLFLPLKARTVVWSFGHAWSQLDKRYTVERFGLRAGLNALLTSSTASTSKKDGVRVLTSALRAAVVRRSKVSAARPSSPIAFERVDHSSDAAAAVELSTHHPMFTTVSAGRALRFAGELDSLQSLTGYAAEALRLFDRDDYTKDDNYKWVDFTVPVEDPDLINRILDELLLQADSPNPPLVDMIWAPSDRETGLTPSYFCYRGKRSGPNAVQNKELTWQAALHFVRAEKLPGNEALRTRLRFFDEASQPVAEILLWELMVVQIEVDGKSYFVSEGEVWTVSAAHIKNIDALVNQKVLINPAWLPKYKLTENEGSYNQRARDQKAHILFDKELLRLPGQTPFEPCDLLSVEGCLMHVKRKTTSSSMSHLVNQALSATQLLRSNSIAREKMDVALHTLLGTSRPGDLKKMCDHVKSFTGRTTATVDVVIIGNWRGGNPELSKLPLLTRLSLYNWIRQMPCETRVLLVGT